MHNGHRGNGTPAEPPVAAEVRWIEIDLADVGLPAEMPTLDDLAVAASHVYERFVQYADDGWEWVNHPGSRSFDGWVFGEQGGRRIITSARMLSRRMEPDEPEGSRPSHGLSAYRTRQLTGRPWTAEPGSKAWRPLSR